MLLLMLSLAGFFRGKGLPPRSAIGAVRSPRSPPLRTTTPLWRQDLGGRRHWVIVWVPLHLSKVFLPLSCTPLLPNSGGSPSPLGPRSCCPARGYRHFWGLSLHPTQGPSSPPCQPQEESQTWSLCESPQWGGHSEGLRGVQNAPGRGHRC